MITVLLLSVPETADVILTVESKRYVPSLIMTVTSSPAALFVPANSIAFDIVLTGDALVPAALSLPFSDTYIASDAAANTGTFEIAIVNAATRAINFLFIFYSSLIICKQRHPFYRQDSVCTLPQYHILPEYP